MDAKWYEKLQSERLYIKIQKMKRGHVYAILYKRQDKKTVYVSPLHTWIKKIDTKTHVVDHINFDTLDCRESNLRICTDTENKHRMERIRNKTGYIGVFAHHDKFEACVTKDGVRHRINGFTTPEAAAGARDLMAKKLWGEMSRFNNEPIIKRNTDQMIDLSRNTRPNRYGIGVIKRGDKFCGQIVVDGKKYYTQHFDTAIEASLARDDLALKHGSSLNLNFPTSELRAKALITIESNKKRRGV